MDEQRTIVLERAKQEREIPFRWDWVEPTVWTDKMLAALERGVKGDKWFSLIDKVYAMTNLVSAWKKVASNRGSAGIDKVSVQHYKRHAPKRLDRTSELLQAGKYTPSGVRRVWIDKPGSKDKRPLGIPTCYRQSSSDGITERHRAYIRERICRMQLRLSTQTWM